MDAILKTDFGENVVRGQNSKTIKPQIAKGISAARVARAVLSGYKKGKGEVIVPWTMHPVVKLYQMFPGLVEKAMIKMSRTP